MTRILLIRHGSTDLMGRVLYGRMPGVHLNEQGRREAQTTGDVLRSRYKLDGIFSSPIERAFETATILGDSQNINVTTEDGLNELEFGQWEGKPFADLNECEEWRDFNRLRSITRAPGGESLTDVQQRAWRSLEDIHAKHPDKTVAAVTHGDVIRCLLMLFLGMPLDHILRMEISPASVSEIVLGEGEPLVRSVNQRVSVEVQGQLEEANERLKRMAEELKRSNEELEEFARIASHDLSAPITSAQWLVDLLSMRHGSKLDASGQECVRQISEGLRGMSALVDGVLAHARVGKGAIGSATTTPAETAASTALDNLRKDIASSEAVISYDDLPELCIDPHALTQLFQNLLSNAIKYRRPNVHPVIKIFATRQESGWLIAVQDNGIGIPPESLERVFQPMQRLHGSEIEGSGIGLATCKKIVTRAGGKIWAESQVGSGSTFLFTLPGPPRAGTDDETAVAMSSERRHSPDE